VDIDALLQEFGHFGVHLGLEASQRLLASLGNPHQRVPIIHVAGSNGKGSVCAYLSSMLTQAGYRTGRYTSPHLVSWTERICIKDQPISNTDLLSVLQQAKAAIRLGDPSPTQFELFTAAMWLYFAQQQVDIAVIEVGLGGRLDATNVCDRPLVSVITSISLEHTERLGDTLAKIAWEKAGILKPDCAAVIGPLPPEAAAVVSRVAYDRHCPTTYVQPAQDVGNGWALYKGMELYDLDDTTSMYLPRQLSYRVALQGQVQLQNSALAIAALQRLREQGWDISDEAMIAGLSQVKWPGRLQWYSWNGHRILLDGAHNPESAQVLRQFVDTQARQSVYWVMGMLATKNHREIFQTLLREVDCLYLVPVPDHLSANLKELMSLAREVCPNLHQCLAFQDVQWGLQAATLAAKQRSLVVLCGSLYLLGHFLTQVQGGLP
jgi:dihydrofolate synthase/folylpolyglutamate synthase